MKSRNIKYFFYPFFVLVLTSCDNSESITSKSKTKNEIAVEGKFVRLDKIDDRNFNLFLRLSNDSVVLYKTMMPLNQYEISLLKKDRNNIKLIYTEYYNTVTKQVDKIVQKITPIYEGK